MLRRPLAQPSLAFTARQLGGKGVEVRRPEAAGGTRLTQVGELRPNLVGRLFAPFMLRMLRKRFRTIADELDAYLASPAV